jgi:hypothetical protein
LKDWITINYDKLKSICSNISKNEEVDDLFHSCLIQFMENKRINEIPDNQKLFFFSRIVKNNFYSTTSNYHKEYHKFKFNEMIEVQQADILYVEDEVDLNWVNKELNKDFTWYYKRIMELYIEEKCSLTKLSKRTNIPINSCSRDINKVRKELNIRRNKILKN